MYFDQLLDAPILVLLFLHTYSCAIFKSLDATTWVSNSFDSDQVRRFVGPDMGPHCLQRLSTDDKLFAKVINRCLFVLLLYVPSQQLWSWRDDRGREMT